MESSFSKLFLRDVFLDAISELELHFHVGELWTSARVVVSEAIDEFILEIDRLRINNNCSWNIGRGRFGYKERRSERDSKNSFWRLFVSEDTVVPAKQLSKLSLLATMFSLLSSGFWAVKPKAINRDSPIGSSVFRSEDLKTTVRLVSLSDGNVNWLEKQNLFNWYSRNRL